MEYANIFLHNTIHVIVVNDYIDFDLYSAKYCMEYSMHIDHIHTLPVREI